MRATPPTTTVPQSLILAIYEPLRYPGYQTIILGHHDEYDRYPDQAAERGAGSSSSNPSLPFRKLLQELRSYKETADSFVLQGHVVTLEITSGQVYRGKLLEGSSSQIHTDPTSLQRKTLMETHYS